jgi:hypothetical protein
MAIAANAIRFDRDSRATRETVSLESSTAFHSRADKRPCQVPRRLTKSEWGVAEAELGISDTHFVPPQDDEWKRAWAVTEALLSEIHRETSSIGATLVLATMTDPAQVHPDPEWRERFARRLGAEDLFYVEDRLARIAACEGFIFVDTTRPLQAEATRTGKYLHGFENTVLGTGHWNEQAHAVA